MFKSLFKRKEHHIETYEEFWKWFEVHQKKFHSVVNKGTKISTSFFDKIAPKLKGLNDGFWYLTGMFDEEIAELIITPDGVIENIVFVEELIKCAPQLENWKFTALKPPVNLKDSNIEMDGYKFGSDSLSFYYYEDKNFPDEIKLDIVHSDFNEEDITTLVNGVYIYLDNYLGELRTVTIIDELQVISKENAIKDLIPINKLNDFLTWREKEFIEKYEGIRHNTENDNYSSLEATFKNGLPLVAVVNTDLLDWDSKASHPWVCIVTMEYNGSDNNGLPNETTYNLLNEVEDDINMNLKDSDGYLNIGRDSGDGKRRIYLAFQDFRKPSKVLNKLKTKHKNLLKFDFEIFKDKYWRYLEKYNPK